MRLSNKVLLPSILVVITGYSAACESQTTSAPKTTPGIAVDISSDTCPNIEVNAGEQVTWTNKDGRDHIVRHMPEEGDVQFDSGTLRPGDTYAFIFVQPGSYRYECSEGRLTRGTVTVQP